MPGLDPGIHVFLPLIGNKKGLDGRVKPGHDGGGSYSNCPKSRLTMPAALRSGPAKLC